MSIVIEDSGQKHPVTGRPVMVYRQDPVDPSKPIVMTGPVKGDVTLADGTVYNVSDDYIEVASAAHAGEVSHHIGLKHEKDGHPQHKDRGYRAQGPDDSDYDPLVDEFHHVCTAACGPVQRTADDHVAAFEQRLADLGQGDVVGSDGHTRLIARIRGEYAVHNPAPQAPAEPPPSTPAV